MRPSKPPVLPDFQSDRLRLLAPLITPRVIELARERVYTGKKLFAGTKALVPDDKNVLRLALIVAHEVNPFADYHDEEEALIRGIDSDTLRTRKKQPGYRSL